MLIAILILCIANTLWLLVLTGSTYNLVTGSEKAMKDYYDRETMRILTAMFNKDRLIEAMQAGDEVEI